MNANVAMDQERCGEIFERVRRAAEASDVEVTVAGWALGADALCQQRDYAERERRRVRGFRAGADGRTHGAGNHEPAGR